MVTAPVIQVKGIGLSDENNFNISDFRDGSGPSVPCPRCGELIPAASLKCPQCGLNFRGQAGDFAPDANKVRDNKFFQIAAFVILVILGILIVLGVVGVVM